MPSLNTPLLGQGRRLYISGTEESTFGAGATLTHALLHDLKAEPFNVDADVLSNAEFSSGLTSDIETRHLVRMLRMGAKISPWASVETLPLLMYKCTGASDAIVHTSLTTHTLNWGDLPTWLGGFQIEEHQAGATANTTTDVSALGVSTDVFELVAQEIGFATCNATLKGSGRTAAATNQTESGLTIPVNFLTWPKFRVSIYPIADANRGKGGWWTTSAVGATAGTFPALVTGFIDVSYLLSKFTLRVTNKLNDGALAGSSQDAGFYVGPFFPQDRKIELELTGKMDGNFTALIKALSGSSWTTQAEYAVVIDVAGYSNGMGVQIAIPLMRLDSNLKGGTGKGFAERTINFMARKTSVAPIQPVMVCYAVNNDNMIYS